jgi:hypothetical protein
MTGLHRSARKAFLGWSAALRGGGGEERSCPKSSAALGSPSGPRCASLKPLQVSLRTRERRRLGNCRGFGGRPSCGPSQDLGAKGRARTGPRGIVRRLGAEGPGRLRVGHALAWHSRLLLAGCLGECGVQARPRLCFRAATAGEGSRQRRRWGAPTTHDVTPRRCGVKTATFRLPRGSNYRGCCPVAVRYEGWLRKAAWIDPVIMRGMVDQA